MTVLAVDRDPVALTLTIVSEFDAPAARVWQVWADPRQLERWWGPPTYPATVVDHHLTPGGRVTYYMTGPHGEKYHGWWRVIAVDPPHSLKIEDGFADEVIAIGQDEGMALAVGQIDAILAAPPSRDPRAVPGPPRSPAPHHRRLRDRTDAPDR